MRTASFPKVLTNWRASAKAEFPFSKTEKIHFKVQIYLPLSGEAERNLGGTKVLYIHKKFFQTLLFITAEDQVAILTYISLLFRLWMQK